VLNVKRNGKHDLAESAVDTGEVYEIGEVKVEVLPGASPVGFVSRNKYRGFRQPG
jgi:hypothetical protein